MSLADGFSVGRLGEAVIGADAPVASLAQLALIRDSGRTGHVHSVETSATEDKGIILSSQTAQHLQDKDEANDTDAGSSECAVGSDVPGFGKEAWEGLKVSKFP